MCWAGNSFAVGTEPVRRHTFSMIEVVVVAAIMAMILALVAPQVVRMPTGVVVRKTADEIISLFRTASLRARTGGERVILVLDPEGDRFSLESGGGATAEAVVLGEDAGGRDGVTNAAVPEGDDPYLPFREVQLPDEVEWDVDPKRLWGGPDEHGLYRFVFSPGGEASGPDFTLVLRRRVLAFRLDPLTARLSRIQDP
jgi:type II secretory pathway pseudopilin PulG